MNILYISYEAPHFPGGTGGQTRQYCLLKELSKKHTFDFIGPLLNDKQLENIRYLFRDIKSSPPQKKLHHKIIGYLNLLLKPTYPELVQQMESLRIQLFCKIKQAINSEKYDLVHVEHTNVAHWLHNISTTLPKILVAQNVKSVMWQRYYQQAKGIDRERLKNEQLLFEKYESTYLNDYNCVVAMSDVDKRFISQLCPQLQVEIVPNGVDIDYFKPVNTTIARSSLVFTGSMAHPPNNEAAIYFCDNIFPKILCKSPDSTISIVGSSPSSNVEKLGNNPRTIVTGYVEDTRPYIASASVIVVPLLSGSGTRLKILEAMAMQKAIVSTSIGAEGIDYTDNENIMIADDVDSFAYKVIELQSNPIKCEQLGHNARKLIEKKYSWQTSAKRLDNIYHKFAQ